MARWRRFLLCVALAAAAVGCGDDDDPVQAGPDDSVTEPGSTEAGEPTDPSEPGSSTTLTGAGELDGVTLDATVTAGPEGIEVVATVTNDASEPVLVVDRLTTPQDADARYIDDGGGAVRLLRALAGPVPGTAYDQQPTADAILLAPGESLERTSTHRLPTDPGAGPWLGEPATEATSLTFCVGVLPAAAYADAEQVDGPDGPVVTVPDLSDGPVQTFLCSDPVDLA